MEKSTSNKKYVLLSRGLGTTGIIMGILTLLFSLIPIFGMLAIFVGFISLMIIAIGLGIALKHSHTKSQLITALVLTGLGMVLSMVQFSALG